MSTLTDCVEDFAPLVPPPCFPSRTGWLEYLKSGAMAQNHRGEPKVIVFDVVDGKRQYKFNNEFNFCEDCDRRTQRQMQADGKCQPKFLQRGQP